LEPNYKRIYLIRHGETDWNAKGLLQGGGYDLQLNTNGQYQAHAVANILAGLQSTKSNEDNTRTTFDVVVSSHLQRAEQTADIITSTIQQHQQHQQEQELVGHAMNTNNNNNNKPIRRVVLQKFGEMRFGAEFEGINIRDQNNDVAKKFHTYLQLMVTSPSLKWPAGGESIIDVQQRGIYGLQQLIRDFPTAQHIIIVAHGRFNKILLNYLIENNTNTNTNTNHIEKQQQQEPTNQNHANGDTNNKQPKPKRQVIEQDNTCINILDINPITINECKVHVLNFNEHSKNWQ
jgi:broad specificity phosphatase PhoE